MTKRSKVETRGHADQILHWLVEEGKTEAWCARKLNELDPDGKWTQPDVHRFKSRVSKRIKTPLDRVAKRWDRNAGDALSIVQRSVSAALKRASDRKWDRDTRETILVDLKIAAEKLKILGQYGPDIIVQQHANLIVADRASIVRELLEALPNDLHDQVRAALVR